MSKIDILSNLAEELEETKLAKILEEFNELLRTLVTKRSIHGKLDHPKLARHIQYLAMAIAEDKNSRRTKRSKNRVDGEQDEEQAIKGPAWMDVANAINNLCKLLNGAFGKKLPLAVSNDNMSAFASFKTASTGVKAQNFYVAVALYIIHAEETGETNRPFFKFAVPQRERDLPKILFEELRAALRSEVSTDDADPNHEITVNFNIKKSNTENFARYFDQYTFSEDGRLHLVVYRPMRTKPTSLIKTFCSISRHQQEANSFGFAHFYEPIDGSEQNRFSAGKVLPMENGLYLAGGQKPQVSEGRTDQPFHSLKTLAFRWAEINNNQPLLPGLAMSTNYSGQQLISRVVARVTAISHSDDVELREVANGELVANLKADMDEEKKLFKHAKDNNLKFHENAANFPQSTDKKSLESVAAKILSLTNNRPSQSAGFGVPDGCSYVSGEKKSSLSASRLETIIEDAMSTADQACVKPGNEPYDFWADTRFGPLTIL